MRNDSENMKELTDCPECGAALTKRPKGYRCFNCGLRIKVIDYDPTVQDEEKDE